MNISVLSSSFYFLIIISSIYIYIIIYIYQQYLKAHDSKLFCPQLPVEVTMSLKPVARLLSSLNRNCFEEPFIFGPQIQNIWDKADMIIVFWSVYSRTYQSSLHWICFLRQTHLPNGRPTGKKHLLGAFSSFQVANWNDPSKRGYRVETSNIQRSKKRQSTSTI